MGEDGDTRPSPTSYDSLVTVHLQPVKRTERSGPTVSDLGKGREIGAKLKGGPNVPHAQRTRRGLWSTVPLLPSADPFSEVLLPLRSVSQPAPQPHPPNLQNVNCSTPQSLTFSSSLLCRPLSHPSG